MSRITEVTPLVLNVGERNLVFVRVRTADGVEGIGEGTIPHKARTLSSCVQDFAEFLIGQEASQIERLWQSIYRHSFFRGGPIMMTALSAIEQALWDIRGKELGQPVWNLLGGAARDRLRVYSHAGGPSPQAVAEHALRLIEAGYRAVKLGIPGSVNPILDERAVSATVANVRAVREACGDGVDLMVDCHAKPTPPVAIRLANELAPYHPLFLEEPIPPENVDALVTVARASPVPIATGERLYTRWGFREVIEKQAAIVLQPDLGHAGGILEVKKIAAMGEAYYCSLAPHNPRGPGVTMASLHVGACTHSFLIQEIVFDDPHRAEMLVEPYRVVDGYVDLPRAPGLGLRWDDTWLERHPFRVKDTAHPSLADGTPVDW
jgi:galactonate dehydratase